MEQLFISRGGVEKKGTSSESENKKENLPDTEAGRFISEGIARHNEGKYKEAVKLYTRALRISIGRNDISSEAYYRSAESNLALNNYRTALNDVDMAIYLKGPQCDYYLLREKINSKSGNDKDAGIDREKLKELKCRN